jgi:hypothetical protein
MRDIEEVCPEDPHGSDYRCPSCGFTGAREEHSLPASSRRQTPEQPASTVREPGMHTASSEIEGPAPNERRAGVLVAGLEHPGGGPLDERELRIMRLLYGESICPGCARLSRGTTP